MPEGFQQRRTVTTQEHISAQLYCVAWKKKGKENHAIPTPRTPPTFVKRTEQAAPYGTPLPILLEPKSEIPNVHVAAVNGAKVQVWSRSSKQEEDQGRG